MGAEKDRSSRLTYEANISAEIVTKSGAGEDITIPAGAAATVKTAQIANFPVRSANGGSPGGFGDSSFSMTSAAFTTEVLFGKKDVDLANGEFYINYLTGEIRGKKATTGTTATSVSYKVVSLNISIDEVEVTVDVAPKGRDGYKYYIDTNFVVGDTGVVLDVDTDLSRAGVDGYLANDGVGTLTFTITTVAAGSPGDAITLLAGEVFDFNGIAIDQVIIAHVADTKYSAFFN
ncbi:MAG: hypothetical protein V3T43_06105 [Nitrosomonadaceae bacterium]